MTSLVTVSVKPELAEQFDRWLHATARDAMRFKGHLGVDVLRSVGAAQRYTVIFRFRSPNELASWMGSDIRVRRLAEGQAFFAEEPRRSQASGMESWFELPELQGVHLPRYKMALVTFIAIAALLQVVPRVVVLLIGGQPPLVRTLCVSAAIVTLMTWIVMPVLTRLLRPWLH